MASLVHHCTYQGPFRRESTPTSRRSLLFYIRGRLRTIMPEAAKKANLLVVSNPKTPELAVLQQLPDGMDIVATGQTLADFGHLTGEQWASIDCLLNCGVGENAGKRKDIQEFWGRLTGLKWLHSSSAGLEHLLFPEMVDSPVLLTNAKGVYSHSLAEYAITCCNWFAKDFARLVAAKAARKWDVFEVEELRGKTLGVVGYGDIGRATAQLARAFRMRVIALRRNTKLSAAEQEEGVVEKLYSPDQIEQLMAASDYVVLATPYTPATHHIVSAAAIAAMKPTGVIVNVGRGKCIDEAALIDALRKQRIRGAALDVFVTEPLPPDSPLWDLPNVFMSPHNADRTKEFQFESIEQFVQNAHRYLAGEELLNVCDKASGY
eukprot:GHRR01005156.1.p1 GENE.GHRR01005156.1~~GHRR01005156.1.p1  ORF type:complete len:377 (+),score=95.91 GHRR01005156.1:267-1397(+)